MNNYIRLTYASTTTSKPAMIRQHLVAILNEAQLHNSNNDVFGVLFYGNNYFFQCIEGNKAKVDMLYEKLLKDKRHKDMVLLSYTPINKMRFIGWNMKYVLHEPDIMEFFQSNHWEKFNPYALDEDLIEPFLNILVNHNESTPGAREEVVGRETARGHVLNYKYAGFIVVIALMVLGVIYLLTGFGSSAPVPQISWH
ncbi:MAG: BLUF domain-containing protein [Moraxellaceae bacterium]|nr:MAG: BLUF domain-containing protein [Moraxellaceae bacterium]